MTSNHRLLRVASTLGALLTTAVVVAQSTGLTSWKNGQTLSADALNANFGYLDARITSVMNTIEPPPPATAADAEALPLRLFRVVQNEACVASTTSDPAHYADCTCAVDEIAISGGGYCGPSNGVIENASIAVNGDRLNRVWRLQCADSNPLNFYALCLKVSR